MHTLEIEIEEIIQKYIHTARISNNGDVYLQIQDIDMIHITHDLLILYEKY
jgi:hypothetical protein